MKQNPIISTKVNFFKQKFTICLFKKFLGAAGKKNRLKERRLMKGFNLSTSGLGTSIGGAPTGPPGSGNLNKLDMPPPLPLKPS